MRLSYIALRNLGRHKIRTALSISTIVMASILGLFMLSFVAGMKSDIKNNILAYYTGSIQIRHGQYQQYDYLNPVHLYVRDEADLRKRLVEVEGVTGAVPRITAGGKIYIDADPDDDIPGDQFSAMAMGIDFAGEKDILGPESLLVDGRLPLAGSRDVVVGYGLARKLGLAVGDRFSFMTTTAERGLNAMTFTISGLVDFPMQGMNETYFLLPFDTMQGFVRMTGGAQEILLTTADPDSAETQFKEVERLLASDGSISHLSAKLWKEQGDYYAMLGIAALMYNIIVMFFLALGATVIVTTTMMVIYERYREIGILGAMGMTPGELVRLFFLEAFFAGVISAIIGISLGSALVLIMEKTGMDFGSSFGSVNIEMSSVFYPDLKPIHVILMTIYTVGIPALVTFIPSRKAARIEPIDAIRAN